MANWSEVDRTAMARAANSSGARCQLARLVSASLRHWEQGMKTVVVRRLEKQNASSEQGMPAASVSKMEGLKGSQLWRFRLFRRYAVEPETAMRIVAHHRLTWILWGL